MYLGVKCRVFSLYMYICLSDSWGVHVMEYINFVIFYLIKAENQPQNVPLPTPKMHYGAIFQLAMHETWQEYFYTTL